MKLRNVVQAVAQFRTGLIENRNIRRQSTCSTSETESYTDDGQSVDSYMDSTVVPMISDTPPSSMVKSISSTILIENSSASTRQKTDVKNNSDALRTVKPRLNNEELLMSGMCCCASFYFMILASDNFAHFLVCNCTELIAGGMSDRGYNSMTLEDAQHIQSAIGSADSLNVKIHDDSDSPPGNSSSTDGSDIGKNSALLIIIVRCLFNT